MMFGQAPVGLPQVQPLPNVPTPQFPSPDIQAPPKRGMFGGAKIDLAGAIAGYLAGIGNPAGIQALQAMNERRRQQAQMEFEAAQSERTHQQGLQDQISLYDYKSAHPDTPDIQQRVDVLNKIHPGLGDTYAQNYARNGGGLGIVTNAATGQQYAQPSSLTPPAEAIARLRANPAEASQFDEIFGAGTSAGILGGPAPQAPGGFPGH